MARPQGIEGSGRIGPTDVRESIATPCHTLMVMVVILVMVVVVEVVVAVVAALAVVVLMFCCGGSGAHTAWGIQRGQRRPQAACPADRLALKWLF
jgi:hypothetical protein